MEMKTAWNVPVWLTSVSHEAAEDFLLPDYLPGVRRIVSVETTVLPENRFLGGGALEFGGTAAYSVLYVGEDGAVTCVPLTSEYAASSSLGDAPVTDAASVGIDTTAESVSCRVTGPRRLSLRCRMRTHLCALAPRELPETVRGAVSPADEAAVERRPAEAPDAALSRGEATATAGGELRPGAGARILRCTGSIHVESATAAAGAVGVRGEAILRALCLGADGAFFCASARAPIDESVTVPGAEAGDSARAWGRCASVTVRAEEGAPDGAARWEMEFDLEAEAARACPHAYTADAYSTACKTELTVMDFECLRLLRCGGGSVTVSGTGGRRHGVVPGERVIDACAAVTAEGVDWSGRKLTVRGTCALSVLIAADGDVVSEEFSLPIRYECEACADGSGEVLARVALTENGVAARLEGDAIAIEVELDVSVLAFARERVRAVSEIALDRTAPHPPTDGLLRIAFPDPGETVWSVAKRYAVPCAALAESCGREPEEACVGAVLIG